MVFESRMLRRIFGPKRVEMTGAWRNMHNMNLHYMYSSPNIMNTIKSRAIRWVKCGKDRTLLESPRVAWRKILKLTDGSV
jgi:hypothetical protein